MNARRNSTSPDARNDRFGRNELRSPRDFLNALDRLTNAGAVPTTALAVLTEMFRDWRSPLAAKALEVIDWYFEEVPKISSDIGVDHREKVPA